jgi:hypothetical protein
VFAALYAPSVSLASLLDVARAFSPRFESYGSLVILDASGLSRLFGSPLELGTHLHHALVQRVDDQPSRARVALASTQVTAALMALGRPGLSVVAPGEETKTLAPLSLAVLSSLEEHRRRTGIEARSTNQEARTDANSEQRLAKSEGGWSHPRHTHQASRIRPPKAESRTLKADKALKFEERLLGVFAKWGIHTLGGLAALPGPDVYERLGGLGVAWQQLARGEDRRPLVPWVADVPFEVTLELEWPIDELEPLSFVLARLLEPLSLRLEQADRGAAVLHTSLRLTTKAVVTRTLQLPTPMRDPKTLRTLIMLDLESHPPEAAVDTVRVFIEPTPGRVLQWTLLDRAQPAPEQVSTLVARLTALMGSGHVGSPRLLDSWRPGAFEMAEFLPSQPTAKEFTAGLAVAANGNEGGAIGREGGADHDGGLCGPAILRSALRRFRLPIPARVQMAEGRPVRVNTDRHGFTSGAIVTAAGPWRTSGEWWEMGLTAGEASSHPPQPSLESDRARATAYANASADRRSLGGGWSARQAWDRDEWDVAMHDGTIYRLSVERSSGQWFLEGIID